LNEERDKERGSGEVIDRAMGGKFIGVGLESVFKIKNQKSTTQSEQ
jgi:hypothetical protein